MCQQTHSPFTYFKLLIGIFSIRLSVCPTIYMSVSSSVRLSRYLFRTQTRRNLLRYFVCRHSLQSKSTMGIINNRWMDGWMDGWHVLESIDQIFIMYDERTLFVLHGCAGWCWKNRSHWSQEQDEDWLLGWCTLSGDCGDCRLYLKFP